MSVSVAPRSLGGTGLRVSPLCLGTSGWGRLREGETYADRTARTVTVAERVLVEDPELNVIDTSNIYGDGESERTLGSVIERLGGLPHGRVIITKLDRDTLTGDFTGEQMRRSLAESLKRLHLDSIQVLFLHDPEHIGFAAAMAPGGPVEALIAMKESGLAVSIGISGGPVPMLQRFVDTGLFDHLISHNRFTLIERSATGLYESAKARGMGVLNAAPYGRGALSGRPGANLRYAFSDASPEIHAAIVSMDTACADAGVTLGAAALQFSMRSPLVDTTIIGASSIDRLETSVAHASVNIPDTLWNVLDELAPVGFALDPATDL